MLLGSNIHENKIDWKSARRITEDSNRLLPASRLNAGDLVTVRVGEPGITAVIPPEWDGCNCASMMVIRQSPVFNSLWLCYVMNSRIGRSEVDQVKYGSAQKQFNISDAVDFSFPVPPLSEQRAIAAALSDVDELIGSLDKLIAKKRAVKLATMQQLLTGKTRLPGFGGEWSIIALRDLADIQRGASPRPIESPVWYDTESKVGWVRISDIANSDGRTLLQTRDYLSAKGVAASRFIPAGTLIMSICATVGRPVITGFSTCIHDGFVSFSSLRNVDQGFLFYKLKELEPAFTSMGQTGSQANLNTDIVRGCEFRLPRIDEQAAIARVLSDMDAEIDALEQRREKTKAIKQGMMQALLTGRVRLVEPEAAA